MASKTKIVVLHMKELIYTIIFIVLAIVLIALLVFMFHPGKEKSADKAAYKAGVYTSSVEFQGQTLDVQVVVDDNHINSVDFVNLEESVATMYPLMQTAMSDISQQVCAKQSVEDLTFSDDSQYTSTMLLTAVEQALDKAKAEK